MKVDEILSELNIKASRFAKNIGVHPTQIYDLQSGKTKSITPAMADKILAAYPQFSRLWLLLGEGEMLNSYKTDPSIEFADMVKDRLNEYLKAKKIGMREFSRMCDVGISVISRISETTTPKTLRKIEEKSDLNTDWLITGEGEMLNSYKMESNAEFVGVAKAASFDELPMVRFFEVTPTATFQEFCSGMSEEPSMINIMPVHGEHVDDSYCAFEIYGESMAPQIQNGARVLCQEIRPTTWHTVRSGVVVIAYGDQFVIKRIIKNDLDRDNTLTLGSDNPDYPQQHRVQMADIRCIFRAVRILSQPIN